jgi:cytochrome c oxidase assembly protein subunit 15
MFVAMLVLVVLIMAYMRARELPSSTIPIPKQITWFGVVVSIIALIQVMLGTQVRETVDVVAKMMGAEARAEWIANLGFNYTLHIRFYWVLLITLLIWLYRLLPFMKGSLSLKYWSIGLVTLLSLEIIFGISMHYFAIPPMLQPLHLLFGTSIFTLCYFITASCRSTKF